MSQGYNRVTLFGNLGADPELRKTANGHNLLRMRLATNQSWFNKEGEREERTDWHNVVLFGNRAEGLARILRKGSFVLVEGQIRTHSYEKDGEKRYVTEIYADEIVLGGRNRPSDPSYPDDAREARADGGSRSVPDTRADAETQPDAEPYEPGERRPSETFVPSPPDPKPSRGGDGGAAEAEVPPAPARRRTRSPAPAPIAAAA